jgi:hypothetical protein
MERREPEARCGNPCAVVAESGRFGSGREDEQVDVIMDPFGIMTWIARLVAEVGFESNADL